MKKLSFCKFMAVFSACALLTVFVPLVQAETVDAGLMVDDLPSVGLFDETYLEDNQLLALTDGYAEDPYKVEFTTQSGQKALHVFTSPVKYMDNEGKPRFIDSRFKEVGFNLFSADSWHYDWVNTANAFKLYVSSAADRGVKLVGDTFSITQKTDNAVGNLLGTFSGGRVSLGGTARQYTYENTATGYIGKVALQDTDTQSVTLQLEGKNIDRFEVVGNAVVLYAADGDTVIYNAPVLTDENQTAYTVDVTAKQQGEDYNITYAWDVNTADPLNLQYEVTVRDGTEVQIRSTAAGTSDWLEMGANHIANVQSFYPDQANLASTNQSLFLGSNLFLENGMPYRNLGRIYLRFDLSNVNIAPSQVVGSTVCLVLPETAQEFNEDAFQVEVYRVMQYWQQSTLTWNGQPDFYEEKISTTNLYECNADWHKSFVVNDLTRSWLAGVANYGLMIKERQDGCRPIGMENLDVSHTFGNTEQMVPYMTIRYDETISEEPNGVGIVNNGIYYIKSKRTGKYLTAMGSVAGSTVWQADYTGATNQQWKLTQYNSTNKNYRLIPQNAPTLSLANVNDVPTLKAVSSPITDKQVFKFFRNWDGTYHIAVCSLYLSSLYLDRTGNGIHFEDYEHTLDFWDDWTLEKVGGGTAKAYGLSNYPDGVDDEGNPKYYSTYPYLNITTQHLSPLGYTVSTYSNATAAAGVQGLLSSNVWIVNCHGGISGVEISYKQYIWAYDGSNYTGGTYVYTNTIADNALANVDLIILATCGDPIGSSSLAYDLYNKGAHLVLSFTTSTSLLADYWVGKLLEYCAQGKTVQEAAALADEYLYTDWLDMITAQYYREGMENSTDEEDQKDYARYLDIISSFEGANQHLFTGDTTVRLDN